MYFFLFFVIFGINFPFVVLHFLVTPVVSLETRRHTAPRYTYIYKERFERDFLYSRSARTVSKHTQNLNNTTFLKECCLSSPIIIIIIESRRETDNGHEEK